MNFFDIFKLTTEKTPYTITEFDNTGYCTRKNYVSENSILKLLRESFITTTKFQHKINTLKELKITNIDIRAKKFTKEMLQLINKWKNIYIDELRINYYYYSDYNDFSIISLLCHVNIKIIFPTEYLQMIIQNLCENNYVSELYFYDDFINIINCNVKLLVTTKDNLLKLDKTITFNEIGFIDCCSIIEVIDILKEKNVDIAHICIDEFDLDCTEELFTGIKLFIQNNHIEINENRLYIDDYFDDIMNRYDSTISIIKAINICNYIENDRVLSFTVNEKCVKYSDYYNKQLIKACELGKYSPTKKMANIFQDIKSYITLRTLCE